MPHSYRFSVLRPCDTELMGLRAVLHCDLGCQPRHFSPEGGRRACSWMYLLGVAQCAHVRPWDAVWFYDQGRYVASVLRF